MNHDQSYLGHITDYIARVERYVADSREAFMSSTLIQDAVIRNLQVLAESTRRLSDNLKSSHPEVDWRGISAFRNVLVHDYLSLDLGLIWDVVERDLPDFKLQVDALLW